MSKTAFKRPPRQCFQQGCTATIEFRKTPNAPHGAWVDTGTLVHHRCKRNRTVPAKKPHQSELFGFEELHPSVVRKPGSRWPLCSKCGEPVYAQGGPHMDWCEPCLWAYLDNDIGED